MLHFLKIALFEGSMMEIMHRACGAYGTNCYIVKIDGKELIIDPGVDAFAWVERNVAHPVAILNTHGHFDHVWSNAALVKRFAVPIYAPKDDCFMLENDPFLQGTPSSKADVEVVGNQSFTIEGIDVTFLHCPGHTPGCSMIRIADKLFSGDFIFRRSIGRYDFPYSDASQMRRSLEQFLTLQDDWEIFPGHGEKTGVKEEQKNIPYWLEYF